MLTQVLYDLVDREELTCALRDEIKTVLPQGWTKATVNQLKLMDSVLKESQRLKPVAFGMLFFALFYALYRLKT